MNKQDFEKMLRKPAPKPRKLQPCGTGAFLGDHQFCFEKGWREGIAAYRKMLREELHKEAKE